MLNDVLILAYNGYQQIDQGQFFLGQWELNGCEFSGLFVLDNGLCIKFVNASELR